MLKIKSFFLVGLLTMSLASTAKAEHHHHISLFAGATHAEEISYGTYGLDYEYHLTPQWSLGVGYESIATDPSTTVATIFVAYHFDQNLKFIAGIGQESIDGESEGLQRLGIGYDFHFGEFTLGPVVAYDFLENGHTGVEYGLAYGYGF